MVAFVVKENIMSNMRLYRLVKSKKMGTNKRIDLDRAIEAFRWVCPNKSVLKKIDGTKEVYECFAQDCEKREYRCKGNICPRLRKFINILKEPEQ